MSRISLSRQPPTHGFHFPVPIFRPGSVWPIIAGVNRQAFDHWLIDPHRPPLLMGVLNVTPDSFSDGGLYAGPEAATAHGLEMIRDGADMLDIGGESTRPGAPPVEAHEQIRRVVPVIQALRRQIDVTISVDTTRADVAAAALDAGAHMINDISAGRFDPGLLPLAARRAAPIILMHMLGTPATMQVNPVYQDVAAEVALFLHERTAAAVESGVHLDRILLDPGIGFGKTVQHNLQLLREMDRLLALGRPLVIGTSRKRFIGTIIGEADPNQRLFGTAATIAWSVANGAAVVRVHDVKPMAQVLRMTRAILNEAVRNDALSTQ